MVKIFHRGVSQYYELDKRLEIWKYGAWVEEIVFVLASSKDPFISSNSTITIPINK